MHVFDAGGVGIDELGRVRAADEQVPGVEAERDLRSLKYPFHFFPVFDHRAHVRMERDADAAGVRRGGDPVEVGQQGLPAGVVEVGSS